MYVTNIDSLPKDSLYYCNKLVADWLMIEKNIPLMGNSKNGKFVFSKTELLLEVLKSMPFYLKITKLW